MTIIHERTIRNGRAVKPKVIPAPKPETPKPETPKPETPKLIIYTRLAALAITISIAVSSFVLSFATLCDLAHRAGYPSQLAWLWPLSVDGTIVQATMAIVALAGSQGHLRARQFFWSVLGSAAAVSVGGNILHPFIAGHMPVMLAAAVDCMAPLSLLATTHGLAVLSRFNPEEG